MGLLVATSGIKVCVYNKQIKTSYSCCQCVQVLSDYCYLLLVIWYLLYVTDYLSLSICYFICVPLCYLIYHVTCFLEILNFGKNLFPFARCCMSRNFFLKNLLIHSTTCKNIQECKTYRVLKKTYKILLCSFLAF